MIFSGDTGGVLAPGRRDTRRRAEGALSAARAPHQRQHPARLSGSEFVMNAGDPDEPADPAGNERV
jgi:hypothetical protein